MEMIVLNAVGIDVTKGNSVVSILRPFGEVMSSPFEVPNTSSSAKCPCKIQFQQLYTVVQLCYVSSFSPNDVSA